MGAITFLGLGAMGSRMATRLATAGFAVTTWSRTSEGPLPRASSPEAAARGASTVISMVRDDEASSAVWARALEGLQPGALAIECSTLSPARVDTWAAAVRARGGVPLEAPVVGSRPHAEAGTLVALVGGDSHALEQARGPLGAMAGTIHHVGPLGHGARTKLLVNALFATQVAALAELVTTAAASGLEVERLAQVLSTLPVMSPAARGALDGMLLQRFEPQFPVALVEKDLRYAARLNPDKHPVLDAVYARFQAALDAGLGERNLTSVVTLR